MVFQQLILLLSIFAIAFPCWAQSRPLRITYISSNAPAFWQKTRVFAQEVAGDLGIELTIVSAENRFEKLQAVDNIIASEQKPDYLIFSFPRNAGVAMLEKTDRAGIDTFLVNSEIPQTEKAAAGEPRGKYKHWLGHMYPDDKEVGYSLADFLIGEAKDLRLNSRPLEMVGVGGPATHLPATLRNAGLRQRVSKDSDVALQRIASTQWLNSGPAVTSLFKLYPDLKVVWTASDRLALECIEAASALGKVAGKDFITGGIDWSEEGLQAIKDGSLAISYGGHHMEAGWAIILLYDYSRGLDFIDDIGTTIDTSLMPVSRENITLFNEVFSDGHWKRVDFRRFSKSATPQLEHYQFNVGKVFSEYKTHQSGQ